MADWKKNALVALKRELKDNVKMVNLTDMLQREAGGFMNRTEAQVVTSLAGDANQMDKIVETLLGKGEEDFSTFCQMLRLCNYAAWAKKLKKKAKGFKAKHGMLTS